MRADVLGVALVASVTAVAPAFAQSPLDGPLAAPDAPLAAPAAPAHHARPKKKIHHAAGPAAPVADSAPAHVPTADPAPASPSASAGDPLSLGMKWNGNNDSAAETRSQNLDGNAFGTGAEVGMKLHF